MATVEYDEIQLKIGSTFDKGSIDKAIENLERIKQVFPIEGVGNTAKEMKAFADAVNSIKSDTIKALANMKSSLSKAAQELQRKDKTINVDPKISIAKKEIDNAIKLPFEQAKPKIKLLDLAKERAEEQAKVLEKSNQELAKQQEYWNNINELSAKAAHNSVGSSMTDEQFAKEEEIRGLADELADATKEYERLVRASKAAEEASTPQKNAEYYRQIVNDIREAEAAERAVTQEWQEIGNAIDMDISKTFEFKSRIMDIIDSVKGRFPLAPSHEDLVNMEMAKMDLEEIGNAAKKALSPLQKLANRIKRFIGYRIMRGIWSGLISGFKEGFKNLEDWDRKIGHTGFADSMDKARDSLLAIKNSLAVASAPLLEWLIGILSKVAQWAVTAANAISRFFAILGGKSTYRAVHYAEGIAAAERNAAGSAKKANNEFKKQLMAFDEINNLTAQNDSGGGGGSGSGYSSGSLAQMFSEEDVGEVSDTEKKLKAIYDWLVKIAEKTKEWLKETKPISTALGKASDWYTDWVDTVERVKMNIGDFVEGFTNARKSGATFIEAIQAGLDNIGKHDAPEKLHDKWDEFVDKSALGFSHLKITASNETDLLAGNVDKSFNKMYEGGEHAFKGVRKSIDEWMITPLEEAEKQGDETKGVFKRISDFAKKWLLPLNINDPLTTPLANAKANAEGTKGALEGIGGKTFKPTVPLDGLTNAEREAKGLKSDLDKVQGTYTVNVNINEKISTSGTPYKPGTYGFRFEAGGGYVNSGQMFVAREAGPELVGTIGSHTAVANNDQIVAAVSQGVASAVSSVLGGQSTNVSVTLEGDAKGLFKVVQKEGRAYSARTGQPAMA